MKKVKKHNCVKWTFVLLSQADIWLSHALPNNYYDYDNIEEFRKYGRRAAISYVATSFPLIIFKIMLISYLLIMGQQVIKILEGAGYVKYPTLARVLMFCLAFFQFFITSEKIMTRGSTEFIVFWSNDLSEDYRCT